jgi:DDE superfamily endonuclease
VARGLYDAVGCGRIQVDRLRRSLVALPLPRDADGRIVLAVDVSAWLRPDAATSPDRLLCHVDGRGQNAAQMIPGWPYAFVAALEPGRSSWTALLDVVRLRPCDDATEVTAAQVRELVGRLRENRAAPAGRSQHPWSCSTPAVWLWFSHPDLTPPDVDRLWQVFLRRFDLEHTFRFLTQTLGWTRPRIRTPEQGDRWTWLIIAAHTPLRLAHPCTTDLRRPWDNPATRPDRLTELPPGSAAGVETSDRKPPYQPAHQTPRPPRLTQHTPPPTITSANTPPPTPTSPTPTSQGVKRQAEVARRKGLRTVGVPLEGALPSQPGDGADDAVPRAVAAAGLSGRATRARLRVRPRSPSR